MSPIAAYVVETLVTLIAVIALAILVLYGARRLGLGRPLGPIQLVGRLGLDARRSVVLVRVVDQVLVLGVSEAGIQKLGEVSAAALQDTQAPPERRFADILARLRSGASKPSAETQPAEPRPAPDQSCQEHVDA